MCLVSRSSSSRQWMIEAEVRMDMVAVVHVGPACSLWPMASVRRGPFAWGSPWDSGLGLATQERWVACIPEHKWAA